MTEFDSLGKIGNFMFKDIQVASGHSGSVSSGKWRNSRDSHRKITLQRDIPGLFFQVKTNKTGSWISVSSPQVSAC